MGSLVVRRLAVLSFPFLWFGCASIISTHNQERMQNVRVTTDPPGARVDLLEGGGRQTLGVSPVEFERSYIDNRVKSWDAAFGPLAAGLIVGGIGAGILGATTFTPDANDDWPIAGYIGLSLGGLFFLVGLGWLISMPFEDPEDVADDPVVYDLAATAPGFDETRGKLTLGFSAQNPKPAEGAPVAVHIVLDERWWERYGMKAAADKLAVDAVPKLQRALSDKKAIVRKEAAEALAEIGPPAKAAVGDLVVLIGDGDVAIRRAAILALEAIRAPDPRAIASLQRAFEYDADPELRELARDALQKLSLLRISAGAPEREPPEPSPRVPRPETKPDVQIIAVTDVADSSGKFNQDILVQLTTYLSTALTRDGKYQVVPRDRLRATLAEQKKESYRQCMDESCQIELGRAVSANKLVSTQLLQVGNKCAVTANLYDLKTETAQKGAMLQTGCSPDELLDAMQKIADQL